MKNSGFTLAEVLITLGIIGVVAALTVPTLMQNHQRKVYVTQLQKVYTELSQAFQRQINDNNALNLRESGLVATKDFSKEKEFLHKYFKVVKDCGTDLTPCFAEEYSEINGGTTPVKQITNTKYAVTIASGATIGMRLGKKGTADKAGINQLIFIDTNGAQGPNIRCRDMFNFTVSNDGEIRGACLNHLIQKGWIMDEEYDADPYQT